MDHMWTVQTKLMRTIRFLERRFENRVTVPENKEHQRNHFSKTVAVTGKYWHHFLMGTAKAPPLRKKWTGATYSWYILLPWCRQTVKDLGISPKSLLTSFTMTSLFIFKLWIRK